MPATGSGGPTHFTATLLSDHSATVIGTDPERPSSSCCEFVKRKVLSVGDYDELVMQLDAAKLSQMKPVYAWAPDAPVVTITLVDEPFDIFQIAFSDRNCQADKGKKSPRVHGAPPLPPQELCKLEKKIRQLAGTDPWPGTAKPVPKEK